MAKRKAAATTKRARKTSRKAGATRKTAPKKKAAAKNSRAGATKAVARKSASRRAGASARKAGKSAKATSATKARRTARTGGAAQARRASGVRRAAAAPKAAPRPAAPAFAKAPARSGRSTEREGGRKAPSLDRARRTIEDDDIVPTPPSSLDLDRTASAARSGRRQMRERLSEHNETSPALTAGDVDADWESAATVGDEAPGGDNPTPDQDIVDDIGRAVGVQYDDNEELKGEAKITKRDKHRWELDPASSEDFKDR
jgi:hypothetical protein